MTRYERIFHLVAFLLRAVVAIKAKIITDASQCALGPSEVNHDATSGTISQWIRTAHSDDEATTATIVKVLCVGSQGHSHLPLVEGYPPQPQVQDNNTTSMSTTTLQPFYGHSAFSLYGCTRQSHRGWSQEPGTCCLVDGNGNGIADRPTCLDDLPSLAMCALPSTTSSATTNTNDGDDNNPVATRITCPNSGLLYLESDGELFVEENEGYWYFPFETNPILEYPEDSLLRLPMDQNDKTRLFVTSHPTELLYRASLCSAFRNDNSALPFPMFPSVMNYCLDQVSRANNLLEFLSMPVEIAPDHVVALLRHLTIIRRSQNRIDEILQQYNVSSLPIMLQPKDDPQAEPNDDLVIMASSTTRRHKDKSGTNGDGNGGV